MNIPCKAALPEKASPILIVGAGGVVKDAHIPAYRMAGFTVWGICDVDRSKAEALAEQSGAARSFGTLEEALAAAPEGTVFDLAVPASLFEGMLRKLPEGSHVLIQKPMGESFSQARELLAICRERKLNAAVNCQLRFAPFVVAARHLIGEGIIGDLVDLEMRLTTMTPWGLFPFLRGLPRMEILYHSIHYIDLIRSFLGDPRGVMAKTVSHPDFPELASVSSTIILDYPDPVRATITANHMHRFGPRHQESYLKWEGTRGAIKARVGLLMDYPNGVGDLLEYCVLDGEGKPGPWCEVPLQGSWFPEAFIGTMAQVLRHKEGSLKAMEHSVEDVIRSMACVEASYLSNQRGGIDPLRLTA